ncbi:uncharacterized protein LOC100902154, partial [Galendromus occidentalis]|uniref:Ribonucleoside-diphosphate reductase large subunit n=1 Tax=Galendromus occidentalis TaxID=34638 RepID=A0AAJ6VVG2_9ACAR
MVCTPAHPAMIPPRIATIIGCATRHGDVNINQICLTGFKRVQKRCHDTILQLRELVVVKSDRRRVPFDRDKLGKSIRVALRKRPVSEEQQDRLVNQVVQQLEAMGEGEVSSSQI